MTEVDVEEIEPTSYTSESTPSKATSTVDRPAKTAPAGATGRRKEAVARVRIVPGTGQWVINGRTLEDYFPNRVHQQIVNEPYKAVDAEGLYDVVDEEVNRPSLKKAGYLTRDPRAKERKKYGLKKARKAPQYSKR